MDLRTIKPDEQVKLFIDSVEYGQIWNFTKVPSRVVTDFIL